MFRFQGFRYRGLVFFSRPQLWVWAGCMVLPAEVLTYGAYPWLIFTLTLAGMVTTGVMIANTLNLSPFQPLLGWGVWALACGVAWAAYTCLPMVLVQLTLRQDMMAGLVFVAFTVTFILALAAELDDGWAFLRQQWRTRRRS